MGERVDHSQVLNNDLVGGFYVPVVNNVDASLSGVNIAFEEDIQVFSFSQGLGVRFLVNSDEKSMSQHVFDMLNESGAAN
jgi:hypothetical protein